uniref:Uncharacterized protein n=1 Tax=Cucumis melo TaxID=3656 RepID=A0A9I9DL10_CUCME
MLIQSLRSKGNYYWLRSGVAISTQKVDEVRAKQADSISRADLVARLRGRYALGSLLRTLTIPLCSTKGCFFHIFERGSPHQFFMPPPPLETNNKEGEYLRRKGNYYWATLLTQAYLVALLQGSSIFPSSKNIFFPSSKHR